VGLKFVEIRPVRMETPADRNEIVIEKGDMKVRLPSEWAVPELCAVLERLGVHV
jgi:hypothetical protein